MSVGTATAERTSASQQIPTNSSPVGAVPSGRQRLGGRHGLGRLRMVVGNTVISLVGQGVTWVSTLILTIAYGRFLGPSGLGELYLAITLVGLIGFPLEFGFNQQIIRDVARAPE